MRLAKDCSNIIGIKDATGDLESVVSLIEQSPEGFHVISGDDELALPIVLAGGSGVISVIGGALPRQVSSMIRLGLDNQVEQASSIHNEILEMIQLIFKEGNPTGIKSLSNALDLCGPNVRLPLVAATSSLKNQIVSELKSLK